MRVSAEDMPLSKIVILQTVSTAIFCNDNLQAITISHSTEDDIHTVSQCEIYRAQVCMCVCAYKQTLDIFFANKWDGWWKSNSWSVLLAAGGDGSDGDAGPQLLVLKKKFFLCFCTIATKELFIFTVNNKMPEITWGRTIQSGLCGMSFGEN